MEKVKTVTELQALAQETVVALHNLEQERKQLRDRLQSVKEAIARSQGAIICLNQLLDSMSEKTAE